MTFSASEFTNEDAQIFDSMPFSVDIQLSFKSKNIFRQVSFSGGDICV